MEDPALLAGIPLILLGGLGLIIAFSLFAVPDEAAAGGHAVAHPGGDHPTASQYVVIGIILGGLTAVEIALYYIDLNHKLLVLMLLGLSSAKFGLVIGYFMHLKFDNKLFSTLFLGGLALAVAVFTVAVATLQAGLV